MGKKYLETKKDTLESSILGVWQTAIEEGDARMDGRTKEYREHRKKLEGARQRRESKKVNKEEVELNEKPADFIRLSFNSPADVKKAKKWMDQNLPGADQGFTGMDASGKDIEFEGVDDAEDLMAKLKKAGFRFKMDHREEVDLDEGKMKDKLISMSDDFAKLIKKGGMDKRTYIAAQDYIEEGEFKFLADFAMKQDTEPRDVIIGVVAKHMGRKFAEKTFPVDIQRGAYPEEAHLPEAAVNPKDRDELDDDAKDSAKKMKRAQEPAPGQMTEAQSGGKEEYQKFFNAALKKFKVNSPADLKGDDKKKFYDYIDKNWEGDNEKAEGAMSQVREFKIQSMKAALAQVWGMEEGKNPFKKEEDEEDKKKVKTETGKKPATIDLKPKIKD